MQKRFLSLLLALCLCLALFPLTAFAAESDGVVASGSCGATASYVITDDQRMIISGTGTAELVQDITRPGVDALPNYLEVEFSEGITAIGEAMFEFNDHIRSVTLPESLKTIGNRAFYGCDSLSEVRLPAGLERIGGDAFSGCPLYGDWVFPASLRVGPSAFSGCDLSSVVIYGDVPFQAFAYNENLTEVWVMNANTVGGYAFRGCRSLQTVVLADTVTSIGEWAFDSCSRLEQLRLPVRLTEIPVGMLFQCESLKTVLMPAVTTVDANAFQFCNALKEVYYAGTESQFQSMLVHVDGNDPLYEAAFYLLPGLPDPVFGLWDMPDLTHWAWDGIAFCLSNGLMLGTGDGYFQPNATTTRAQLVTILWRMCEEPAATKPIPFTDCGISWADPAIAWAAENGIVSGVGNGLFAPNQPVSRQELVTIFYRFCRDYLELDVSNGAELSAFPDHGAVASWAKDAFGWAVAEKIISGVGTPQGTILQPGGSANRAQIARVILNFSMNVAQ